MLASVTDRLVADGRPSGWNGTGDWNPGMEKLFREKVARLSPDTVGLIADLFDREPSDEVGYGLCAMIGDHAPESDIRAYAAFASPLGSDDTFTSMEGAVRGLREYGPEVLPISADLSREDERTRATCSALVHVALRMSESSAPGTTSVVSMVKLPVDGYDEGWVGDEDSEYGGWYGDNDDGVAPMPVLQDPDFITLVTGHPEKAQEIVEAIEAHGYENARITAQIVLGTVPSALAGGAL